MEIKVFDKSNHSHSICYDTNFDISSLSNTPNKHYGGSGKINELLLEIKSGSDNSNTIYFSYSVCKINEEHVISEEIEFRSHDENSNSYEETFIDNIKSLIRTQSTISEGIDQEECLDCDSSNIGNNQHHMSVTITKFVNVDDPDFGGGVPICYIYNETLDYHVGNGEVDFDEIYMENVHFKFVICNGDIHMIVRSTSYSNWNTITYRLNLSKDLAANGLDLYRRFRIVNISLDECHTNGEEDEGDEEEEDEEETPILSITLQGPTQIQHEYGNIYNDLGVLIEGNHSGKIIIEINDIRNTTVTTVSSLSLVNDFINAIELNDINPEHEFNLIYYPVGFPDINTSRNVIIRDTTLPIISLVGEESISLKLNEEYQELGFQVLDESASNDDVIVTGWDGDTSIAGNFEIIYTVTDIAGNSTSITRKITIEEENEELDCNCYKIQYEWDINYSDQIIRDRSDEDVVEDIGLDRENLIINEFENDIGNNGIINDIDLSTRFLTSSFDYEICCDGNNLVNIPHYQSRTGIIYSAKNRNIKINHFNNTSNNHYISTTGNLDIPVYGKQGTNIGHLKLIIECNSSSDTIDCLDIPDITLIGESNINLNKFDTFNDPGATTTSGNNIIKSGMLDTSIVGQYILTYSVTSNNGLSNSITRTINVVNNQIPNISLIGNSTVFVERGSTYNDLGASTDSEFSINVSENPPLDVNSNGTYIINYSIVNESGVSNQVQRTVIVQDTLGPIIKLKGESVIQILENENYIELGIEIDSSYNYNDVPNENLVITGNVNTSVPGTYTITYSTSDTSGNLSNTLTRTIVISSQPIPEIILNGPSTIEQCVGSVWNDPLGVSSLDSTQTVVKTTFENRFVPGIYQIIYKIFENNNITGNVLATATRTIIIKNCNDGVGGGDSGDPNDSNEIPNDNPNLPDREFTDEGIPINLKSVIIS